MADIAKARVPVTFDRNQIAADANEALTAAFGPAAANAAKLLAGAFASKELLNIGHQGLDELIDREKVAAQSMVELRSISGVTADDIESLGKSMMDLAGFDDEAAKSAANILLRFGAIHDSGTLKRIEQDAADLAVTMGTDLPSAAQTLGQILQDPENATRKLRPLIGSLTDAQKEQIKAFKDGGNEAAAQGVVLQVLEQRIGGAAKAYGETLAGGLDKAHANLTEAKASLVEGLAPALQVGSSLAVDFAHAIEDLPGPLRAVVSVSAAAGVGIVGLAQPIAGLVSSLSSLRAARLLTAATAETDIAATQGSVASLAEETAAQQALEAAQVQRIVSNQALEFSDAEIAAALQAREAAEVQAIVSNQALIASDEAAAAAEAELAAASDAAGASLFAALGPAGLIVGGVLALGAATGQFGNTIKGLDDAKLQQFSAAMDSAFGNASTKAQAVSGIAKSVNDALSGDSGLSAAFNEAGLTTDSFIAILERGDTEFLKHVHASGAAKLAIAELGQATEDSAQKQIAAAVASGRLDQSQADAATSANKLDNGTTNYVAALEQLVAQGRIAPSVLNGITNAAGLQDDKLKALTAQIDAARQAQQQLIPAQFQAEQSAFAVADAQDALRKAQLDATQGITDQQIQLEQAVTSAREQLDAAKRDADAGKLATQAAHLDAQISEAQLALQQAQRDAARARTPDEINRTQSALIAAQDRLRQAEQDRTDHADDAVLAAQKVADAQASLNDALRKEAEFVDEIPAKQRAVQEARLAVEQAEYNQATSLANLNDLQQQAITGAVTEAEKIGNLRTAISQLAQDLPGDTALLSAWADQLDRLGRQAAINTFNQLIPTNPNAAPVFGTARAAGGSVAPGQLFRAAEQDKWEILATDGLYQAPPTGGFVLNHDQSVDFVNGLLHNAGGAARVDVGGIHVHAEDTRSGFDLAVRELVWQLS